MIESERNTRQSKGFRQDRVRDVVVNLNVRVIARALERPANVV